MSYRRRILRRLVDFFDKVGPTQLLKLDPMDIIGKPVNEKYAAALNQLLAAKLVLGEDVGGGIGPAFRLNPDKLDDIKRELRWYRDPAWQFWVGTGIAIAGLVLAILTFLVKKK